MNRPTYIASCSFGKDSLATILLALEHNEPLDRVVFSEVMFDNKRGISGEYPEHIEWIKNVAVPKLEQMGVRVDIVRNEKDDYVTEFYTKIGNHSKHQDRVGKYRGFLIGGLCRMNCECKVKPIKAYLRQFDNVVEYIGIASDETERLARLDGVKKVSLLAKYGYTEKMAYELCKDNNLLSPIYEKSTRGGCWFCPNMRMCELTQLYRDHRELWHELEVLDTEPNKVSSGFKYGKTISELTQRMRFESRQMKLDL